jgi:23S rRNA pseudouridine1911/1915/1917 synthase
MSLVSVELLTGRFHQIRAQFSSRGNPLIGDKKYGSRDQISRHPALYAKEISFKLFGKSVRAVSFPDTSEYPWNKFSEYFNSYDGEWQND